VKGIPILIINQSSLGKGKGQDLTLLPRCGIADGPWVKELLDQMSRVPFHFDEKALRHREKG